MLSFLYVYSRHSILECYNLFSEVELSMRLFFVISGNYLYLNSIIGNNNGNKAKYITFYKTHSSLGLAISTAYYSGSRVAIANDGSTFINPDYKFPSSKSNCTILNKWHVISITWSNHMNLSNCWSNGEKLMTFNTGNAKGYDHCFIGDLGIRFGKLHLIGCIGEIIGFYRSLTDEETLLEKFISLVMFIMNGITYGKIDYHIFLISFIPAISLYFIFLKNLTHPLHSKYLSPFLKEIV